MKKTISAIIALSLLFGGAAYAARAKSTVKKARRTSVVQVANQQAKVDLNTADAKTLMTLKVVGKTRAQRIVSYRNAHGRFKSVNDLTAISGFSKKLVNRIMQLNPGRVVAK